MVRTKQYKVFIASPGDLKEEREIVRDVCNELNENILVKKDHIRFEAVGWEDVIPAAGRPQEIINHLQKNCDVFVCMFHKRYGTPSGKLDSGTMEEFWNAYDSWKALKDPHILFYFKDVQVSSYAEFNDPQLKMVFELKEQIKRERMLLYGSFADPDGFRPMFKEHMEKWISEPQPESPGPDIEEPPLSIPEAYKRWLIDRCKYMDIDRLREKTRVVNVELPEVYIPLFSSKPGMNLKNGEDFPAADFREKENIKEIEALATESEYLLIKGQAGSGKTTLMKHMAGTIVKNESRWGLNDHLPVLIFLKELRSFKYDGLVPNCLSAKKLISYYVDTVASNGLDIETVKAFFEAGKIVFLIDGLDEIEAGFRDFVAHSFADYRIRHKSCKMLLSGRPHGVEGAVAARFGDKLAEVLDFNHEQIETFIRKWFSFVNGKESTTGRKTAEMMISEMKAHPDIDKLKHNPLMLTAICILYHDEKVLPDQRAELYSKFITNLLVRRFSNEHGNVQKFLMELAYTMFIRGDKGIDKDEAAKILKKHYPKPSDLETGYKSFISDKFDDIESSSGLMKLESGRYRFSHLTFQEFLTAACLIDKEEEDYSKAIEKYWDDARYKEVIELYIGSLSMNNSGMANRIVRNVLTKDDGGSFHRWRLASRALLDIQKNNRQLETVKLAADKISEIIDRGAEPSVLADAGETLGWLGDPRNLREFVEIEGGDYKLEGLGKVSLEAFQIGKYPVTSQWYGEFIKAGGYGKGEFWSKEGRKWLNDRKVKQPGGWDDRKWRCPNGPVVGVSWYEADAFTKWLTYALGDGYTYRLLTEKEWQAAAAGKKGRTYPWGKKWEDNRCNFKGTGIGKTSSVGVFKSGATDKGIFDLSGNVWEWTLSDYHSEGDLSDFHFDPELEKIWRNSGTEAYLKKLQEKSRELPVLRGGSWYDDDADCRCASRLNYDPDARFDNVGFRCARTYTLHF